MKILLDHHLPFLLAHGGFQIQIEQTKKALETTGIETEYLRFWDASQRGDVLHFFGRCSGAYIEMAHKKGMPVVMSDLLSGTGSRSSKALAAQAAFIQLAKKAVPASFLSRMGWDAYKRADALIALTGWEAELMVTLFKADHSRLFVIPNGVESPFFEARGRYAREDWLISVGTITERKRMLELAKAAIAAGVKVRFVGRPYSEVEPYYKEFLTLCRGYPELLNYVGAVEDRSELSKCYAQACGFVLLSTFESLSLSALEAAAAGCQLLLSDLPWAKLTFKDNALYCSVDATVGQTAMVLKNFVEDKTPRPEPPAPLQWAGVAEELGKVYATVIDNFGRESTSR